MVNPWLFGADAARQAREIAGRTGAPHRFERKSARRSRSAHSLRAAIGRHLIVWGFALVEGLTPAERGAAATPLGSTCSR